MQWLMSLYVAALFFVLTPGVLVSLPPGGKKMTVALVHAVVFAAVYQLTHKMVWRFLYEGFQGAVTTCSAASARSVCGTKTCKDAAGVAVTGGTTGTCQ